MLGAARPPVFNVLVPVLFDPKAAVEQGYTSSVSLRQLCATHFQCLAAAGYNGASDVHNIPLRIRPIWFEECVWTGCIHFTFDSNDHFRQFAVTPKRQHRSGALPQQR